MLQAPVTGQVGHLPGVGGEDEAAELLHLDLMLRAELQVFKGTHEQLWGEGAETNVFNYKNYK